MRRLGVALCAVALLCGTGCWSRVEVNDLGVVTGMAVDVGETEAVRLTLYLSRSSGTSDTEGRGGDTPQWVVAREGATIADALARITFISPRRVALHHLRIVLIGEEYARQDMDDLLDFLFRSTQIRLITRVLMVEGKAQHVLETPSLLEPLQPESLAQLLEAKGGPDPRLKELMVARASESFSPWVYAVRLTERPARTAGSPSHVAEISGAALLRDDRVVDVIDASQVMALEWLMGNPKEATLSIQCPGSSTGRVSVRVEEGRIKILPRVRNGTLNVEVQASGAVDELNTACFRHLHDPDERNRLERALSEDVTSRIKALIATLQKDGVDPVAVGKWVQLRATPYWRAISQRWPEVWSATPVTVSAQVTLRRAGLLVEPANRTPQELGEPPR